MGTSSCKKASFQISGFSYTCSHLHTCSSTHTCMHMRLYRAQLSTEQTGPWRHLGGNTQANKSLSVWVIPFDKSLEYLYPPEWSGEYYVLVEMLCALPTDYLSVASCDQYSAQYTVSCSHSQFFIKYLSLSTVLQTLLSTQRGINMGAVLAESSVWNNLKSVNFECIMSNRCSISPLLINKSEARAFLRQNVRRIKAVAKK